ncbi:SpoIIE family protein phosphatase [Actinomadura decatromicini]|uniref:protein-serine/threonine phosphatase n=1 Tax=Actinomadura decatromicini TaxID=2604572 RepID=A0A5D3FVB1_9ACTN|nr:SpoIIE family protein phosphatase [Actinomadura decatromicini]TYK51065.1 SpoIIE family protein phosphatase [Actinomadura decatromicini]
MAGQVDDRPGATLERLVEAMNSGVLATDDSGRITAWNPRAQQLLGYTRDEVLGRPMHGLLHRDADGHVPPERDCRLLHVLRTSVPDHGDGQRLAHRDGRTVMCSWSSAPIYTGDRPATEPAGLVVVFQDAADRVAVERERRDRMAQVQGANSRLRLVAEITTVLLSTLNEEELLRRLVRLVVPALGDWAEVDLLVPGGRVERVAATHHELSSADVAALEGPLPPLPRIPRGPLAQVLRGGAAVIVSGKAEVRSDEPLGAAQYELFQAMGAQNAIIAPLAARGETYGALTLGYSRPGQVYGPDDRLVVEDVARRTGLVLANARLYAEQRNTAEAMQRNLLTPLPQPGELRLEARYVPATQVSWVGGDWYDAFALPDGGTGLVIGDIVGHDLRAAARMAEVRNMLRALAWDLAEPPSAVLARLDGVMAAVSEAELATAVFARVEEDPAGRWRLHWCNAGHPPPLLIDHDGDTRFLDEHGVLLGTPDLAGTRPDGTCVLPPSSTLLLYTDGLVETRDSDLSDRLTSLRRHGAHLAQLPLPELCDKLLERVEPGGEDDIALLALRIPA